VRRLVAVALAVCCVAPLASCSSTTHAGGTSNAATELQGTPTDTSPEAGFARDMSVHHAQAVAMAEAIRDRTTDPDLKLLATNIALGQQAQIGRMSGWLDEWGLSQTSTRAPMQWIRADNLIPMKPGVSMPGMDMSIGAVTVNTMAMGPDGQMPGMATRPEVTALGTLPIAAAEISFLQLMIAHHRAGVDMAEAILARTTRPDVVQLASSIVSGQQAEIGLMTEMLAKRGATP
jgi:uncharacterized protein (DUF305 family)